MMVTQLRRASSGRDCTAQGQLAMDVVALPGLLAVVDQTMPPTQASLWLRQEPSNELAAAVGPGTHHQEPAT
jgi:hypothetical protein